ncbi:MAG: wax ester/triacylglycerol synthase domain-containing protein [Micropruina sp.]|nr:DUF1298 domain-containing protein [Micropruina sp.]
MSALTLSEALLLARDQAVQPWHVVAVLILDRPISRDELAMRIAERIGYAPRFRQQVSGTGVQSWTDDTGFRIAGHLREVTLQPGSPLEEWVSAELGRPLDRLHPLWDATLVSGLGGRRVALVVRVHPALIDGVDNVHLLQELLDDLPDPIVGPAPQWTPTPADEPGLGSVFGALSDPLRTLREAAAGLSGMAESAARNAQATQVPRYVAGAEVELALVERAKHRHGGTTHDVLLSIATAGVRGWQLDGSEPLRDLVALVPLAVADEERTSAIGCRLSAQFISLPVTAPRGAERLAALASLTQAGSDAESTVPARELIDLAGFAPPTIHTLAAGLIVAGRPHEALIVNVPGPTHTRFLGEAEVIGSYQVLSTVDSQQISIGITSYRGKVTIAATAIHPLPHFARNVGEELARLTGEA